MNLFLSHKRVVHLATLRSCSKPRILVSFKLTQKLLSVFYRRSWQCHSTFVQLLQLYHQVISIGLAESLSLV